MSQDVGLALLGAQEDESTQLSPGRQRAREKVKGAPRQPQHRHCNALAALGPLCRHRPSSGSWLTPQPSHTSHQSPTTEWGAPFFATFHQPSADAFVAFIVFYTLYCPNV